MRNIHFEFNTQFITTFTQGDFLLDGKILGISDSLALIMESVKIFSSKLISLVGGSSAK